MELETICVRAYKNMGKTALVIGCSGQDGSYLAELLIKKGYRVVGLIRRASNDNRQRIKHIKELELRYADVTDPFSLIWVMRDVKPDEIYNLSAMSHVGISWELPYYSAQVDAVGVLNVLEAARLECPKARIYQASTSELFDGLTYPQNEKTVKNPVSPYGTAKLYGFQIAKNYREGWGMYVCNGILFNHESPRRGLNFVTQKIINAVGNVNLGNIKAKRDWGYAPEYMEMAWRMLQQKKPDDYVVATGETHSVKDFVKWTEEVSGRKLKIIHDKGFDRPTDVPVLCGDATKAKKKLKWKAEVKGKELARIMYQAKIRENMLNFPTLTGVNLIDIERFKNKLKNKLIKL